jgi:serine protease Do
LFKKLAVLLLVPMLGCAASPERVYLNTKDKVVKIGMMMERKTAKGTTKGEGICSGVFIDDMGTVLTCAHCLSHIEITKIFVKTDDGQVSRAIPAIIDKKRDLALLVTLFTNTPYMKLGKEVVRGQEVVSFGSGFGLQHTMTVGYVSNLINEGLSYIFHSAFILPGNSGGPLVDLHGKLVGLNEASLMMNFLVPAAGYYIAIDLPVIKAFLGVK